MRASIVFMLFLQAFCVFSQNLVVNGGFERQPPKQAGTWQTPPKPCTFSSASNVMNTSAEGWLTFDVQTPDLLLWDSTAACPMFPKPHKGNRMAGLIMYHPFQDGQFAFDYHELIQGTLARPLEKGKTYRVSFWVYSNDSLGAQHLSAVYGRTTNIRPTYCGNFGFYFSDGKIQAPENFMVSQLDFPVKPQINSPEIITGTGEWRKVSLLFKADQAYKHFLFGNFSSDAVTPINMGEEERMQLDIQNQQLPFWKKTKRIAYYLFDDFSIVEDAGTTIEQAFLKQKSYTFESALLFDSGKSELRPESRSALDALGETLKKNPSLKIEIGGHTDNTGDDQSNQTLSEQRALAVYNALIDRQIPAAQITWKGYGESKPVGSNDTEPGRQKNRRVECRVVE